MEAIGVDEITQVGAREKKVVDLTLRYTNVCRRGEFTKDLEEDR